MKLLVNRVEQLESKELIHQAQLASQADETKKAREKIEILSSQVSVLVSELLKDREIIQAQKMRIEKLEISFSEANQSINNCCQLETKTTPISETTKIPEIYDWKVQRNLTEHRGSVNSLAISKEDLLISGSADLTIKVWNIKTGQCLNELNGHTEWVSSLAISKEGQLISGSGDLTIKVWDIETGKCLKTLSGHTSLVLSLAISKGGKLFSGSEDNSIKVWGY